LEFITEAAAQVLINEVKILGSQIGELMKRVKLKIKSAKALTKPITLNP
jgi:hypothetical protein